MSTPKSKTSSSFKKVLLASAMLVTAWSVSGVAKAEDSKLPFTEEQRGAMEDFVRDFIMKNPEVLIESVNKMREREVEAQDQAAKSALGQYTEFFKDDSKVPVAGNPKGDVTVVELFDYNCGYCKHAFEAVQKVMDNDKNVRFVFIDLPILSQQSETAAKWALAAKMQGKYWPFHQALMKSTAPKTEENMTEIAKNVGLDVEKLKKDSESKDVMAEIEKGREIAGKLGVTGTPAFIIGDEIVRGYVEYEGFKALIDEQRKNKKN